MAKPNPRRDVGLQRVFEKTTITALAAALKIKPASVSGWPRVPADRVADVAKITGIPAHDLRPDLAAAFGKGQAA